MLADIAFAFGILFLGFFAILSTYWALYIQYPELLRLRANVQRLQTELDLLDQEISETIQSISKEVS